MGPDGALWFVEQSASQIGRFQAADPSGTMSEYGLSSLNGSLTGITSGADTNLWFGDGGGEVGRVEVNVPPTARFTSSPQPPGHETGFDASISTDPENDIASYTWNFGDGATATVDTAATAHLYTRAGTYHVSLTVTDTGGATGTVEHDVTLPTPLAPGTTPYGGYWIAGSDGGVFAFGDAPYFTSLAGIALSAPIVSIAGTADGQGYWLTGADGGVFAIADAEYHGSLGGSRLNAPIVAMAPTADGHGYWLVGADGGVFAFADAEFHGSLGGSRLNAPIVAMKPTADGHGYWLVGADGGVFAFGDAAFEGSLGGFRLNEPIVAMAPTADGLGYWLVGADGGVFAFADARYNGSLAGLALTKPIVAFGPTADEHGYWLVGQDGGVFAFGSAAYLGRPPAGATITSFARY